MIDTLLIPPKDNVRLSWPEIMRLIEHTGIAYKGHNYELDEDHYYWSFNLDVDIEQYLVKFAREIENAVCIKMNRIMKEQGFKRAEHGNDDI